MLMELLSYAAVGIVAGTIAGLLGLGGGLIIVPVLVWLFARQGMPEAFIIHMAVATSLMTIVVTSVSSITAHHRYGNVIWPDFGKLLPGLMLGAVGGALLAINLSAGAMETFFACFALMMAARLWLPSLDVTYKSLLNWLPSSLYGVFTGTLSALVGIGGGTLIVPYLVTASRAMQQAVGTAAACGFPIALGGGIGFMLFAPVSALRETGWTAGLIHWPAVLGIISTSVLFAPLGAKLAKQLPSSVLKRIFSAVLLCVALYFFLR